MAQLTALIGQNSFTKQELMMKSLEHFMGNPPLRELISQQMFTPEGDVMLNQSGYTVDGLNVTKNG